MDEFDSLVATICNGSTHQQARTAAEQRLMEVLCNLNTWKQYISILFQADETVCFFLCIGFQKLVWRHWRNISMEDRVLLNQTIVQTLTNRPNMQFFAKSKLEQVLAAICANSCSMEPALGMLVDANHPHVSTGISAMRTVLELILSEDPQLFPEFRPAFQSAVNEILMPLTNLACSACNVALSSPSSPKETNSLTVTASLDLLKVLITKLQIGPHVTSETIDLLFNVAELGIVYTSSNNTTAVCINKPDANRAALSAMEVLTEIMSKKYLPPAKTTGGDKSVNLLNDMLLKTVNLVQKIRATGNLQDSPIMVSLLEFISMFAESHLERCVSMSTLSQSGGNNTLNPSAGSVNANMNQAVVGFFEEMVATTTGTSEPEILSRIVTVWNRVLSMGSVKDSLLTQPSLCVNMVSHLLQCCLCSSNSNMHDNVEELIEDMTMDPLVDPHIRSILFHIYDYPRNNTPTNTSCNPTNNSSSNPTTAFSAEEVNFIGTVLLRDCRALFTELVAAVDVQQWLTNSVNQLYSQHVAKLSSANAANYTNSAVDLHFLTSLLPLLQVPLSQVIAQLVTLAVQLSEAQLYNRAKEFAVLIVNCCQIAGRLVQCNGIVSVNRVDAQIVNELHHLLCAVLLPCLSHLTASVCNNNTSGTTAAYTTTVYSSMCILLLQTVTVNIDVIDIDNSQCASIKTALVTRLQDPHSGLLNQDALPIENLVLLMCVQDLLQPHSVATTIVAQCLELVNMVETAAAQGYASLDPTIVGRLTKITAALDGLARNHAVSRPVRRQNLIQHFAALQGFMGKYVTSLFRLLLHTYTLELTSGGSSSNNYNSAAVGYLTRLVVSLSCALLQSLGKKSFGKAAADVLSIAVDFAESISSLPVSTNSSIGDNSSGQNNRLLSPAGLPLTKQLLELTQVLAESTAASSPSVNQQAASTYRLLCFIAQGLSDDRVCAELLQPTLKAGVTAVRCYWQKTHRNLPFLAAIAQNNNTGSVGSAGGASNSAGGDNIPDIDGENVRPIAVLLTQLCVGSLSPTVSPQDTLTALEGLILLSEQHHLFAMNWFQNQCWASLLTPCLKAVLLRIHSMHRPQLEQVLIALASAGEASYLALARASLDSMHHNNNITSSGGSSSGSSSPQGLEVGEILYAKYQEFWVSIGNEMIGLATQYQCGEMASHTLYSVLNSYQAAAVAAGQPSAGIANLSPHNNGSSRGPFLIDMRIFIDKIISPVSSEIARLH